MKEEESWGVLTKDQFEDLLKLFIERFGNAIHSKRLSFSFWDHSRNEIDTRIRITDGNPEVMQKVGGIGDQKIRVRTERKIALRATMEDIFNTYKIFRVLIPGDDSCFIYQHDNYLFRQPGFELKMTHQLGKTDKYNFEVEVDTTKVNLDEILKQLNLDDKVTLTDAEFWDKWNKELNLRDIDLTEDGIKELIKKYL